MRKKVKRIAAIIITCAVFISSSYNPVFAEYEDDTDWLYDSETEEDYDDDDYDTDENYDNYDSDYEEDNETVYDDYNTSYDNTITATGTTLQNNQSENTSNTAKETLTDLGTTMIKTKADGTQVVKLLLCKRQGAEVIDLSVDLLLHLGGEYNVLVAALEVILTAEVGVLMENNLIHVEFI